MDLNLIWKAVLIIVCGIFLLRLLGRSSISQMTTSHTVIMISIGTLLIQPIISNRNIWLTFVLASILVLTLIIIELIQMKWDFTEALITGRSKIVIENGALNQKNLKKLRISVDDLEMSLRQNGIEKITDVQWATIEPSGQLGYLLTDKKKFATKEDTDKIYELLNQLISQLNDTKTKPPENNKLTNQVSNLFTEVKKGHSSSNSDQLN
ncbi:DUF421 domain-containing protein [Sporolactobacillus kofuensis]|uniref:DUF421 domain-containing protein n=1 Tax=Sporolactobacillus kofuensis TaxID=269672 RepID=A0ABW1WD12_9BACL|nr:DUF421 domain-containing protein [Sporolactobacillus kofuensis]MCO7174793.1 DUF421 domain-containing protein [Sporolactobacillus kofuensis]